ncbi:hypothetical protein D7030_13120 [Flavobacteriaceae bacterium AU392]|nr:hypothetical protein D1817_05370 [Flavobacteriaceae bacterium]RKM81245.1 hypothetical protein D7030_13120 [Flavobacteriaceae bacterium AU392]
MSKYLKYIFLATIIITFNNCSEDPIENIATGTLTGIVVMNGSNEPIENVRISTNPSTSTVFTDENGEFTIEDVPVDQYAVQAELEGFLTSFEGATITGGTSTNVVFDLRTDDSNNRPPTTPILITPADNAVDVPLETQFNWSASDPDDDDITFNIEIRNDIDEEILAFSTVNDTFVDVTGLRFGVKYFWQVEASDDVNDDEIQSEISAFETIAAPQNRFLFVRNINGNNVIFSADDAGNELQLTASTTNSFRPRRNNAANRVAFLSNSGAQTHIFTMDLNGENIQQVTSAVQVNGFNLDEVDFVWTENGGRLLYSNFDRLYSINADGTNLQQIYQTTDGSFISEVAISADESIIVLKTNDVDGYNVSIFTINNSGTILDTVLSGVLGAAGGLDISFDNQSILYWRDMSGNENPSFRQLDSRVFIYDVATGTPTDLSAQKTAGTNDFDCRFAPNEASVILTNTSNDGISQKDVITIEIANLGTRPVLFMDAEMPDFE